MSSEVEQLIIALRSATERAQTAATEAQTARSQGDDTVASAQAFGGIDGILQSTEIRDAIAQAVTVLMEGHQQLSAATTRAQALMESGILSR